MSCTLTDIYVATVLHQHNMRMLHWNVRGEDFDAAHKLFEEMTDELGKHIDVIAEAMIMSGLTPLALPCVIEYAKEADFNILVLETGKCYDSEEAYKALQIIFTQLLDMYERAEEDSNISRSAKLMLDKNYEFLSLEAKYKNVARLK